MCGSTSCRYRLVSEQFVSQMEDQPKYNKPPGSECLMRGADARDITELWTDGYGGARDDKFPKTSYHRLYGVQREMMPTVECPTVAGINNIES